MNNLDKILEKDFKNQSKCDRQIQEQYIKSLQIAEELSEEGDIIIPGVIKTGRNK